MTSKKEQNKFIIECLIKHNNKYNYDKIIYKNAKDKIIITCKDHGEFTQRPNDHLRGKGCFKCGVESRIKLNTKSQNKFIELAKNIHGDIYNYSKSNYINSITKINIICKVHGGFNQRPANHLQGQGCPQCGLELGAKTKIKSLKEFITKAKKVHGDKYDYSLFSYIRAKTKGKIVCHKHGEFNQNPNNHLQGIGCPKCVGRNRTTKDLVNEFRNIHKNKYNYDKVVYKNVKTKVIIICSKHGEFLQTPDGHLNKKAGCPKCFYKNETKTGEILKELFPNIEIKSQFKISKFRVDYSFEKENQKYIVEYNGEQHYHPVQFGNSNKEKSKINFNKQIVRDEKLRKFCKENNMNLIEIDGREYTGSRIKDYLIEKLLL